MNFRIGRSFGIFIIEWQSIIECKSCVRKNLCKMFDFYLKECIFYLLFKIIFYKLINKSMRNFANKAIIGLGLLLVAVIGTSNVSASYYSLNSLDKTKVEKTVNNVLNDKGYSFCSTSDYTKYISELNNYANYFDRYSRDYNFSKSIATKLQEKCNSYKNRNTNRYQNNCYGSTCNNVVSITANCYGSTCNNTVSITANRCGINGCTNRNTRYTNIHTTRYENRNTQINNYDRCSTNGCANRNTTRYENNYGIYNNCGYNGCERRTYKKGTYVSNKNGIEIRKTGRNIYLYDESKLVLTYVLSGYERNDFTVSKIWGENGFFIISKKNRYWVTSKWFYNCVTNTIAKLNASYIKTIKKDRYGNYYFLATKNGCTTLYKYNGRTITKKSNDYDNIVRYSILSNGAVKIYFYNYRNCYVSQIIR